MSAVGTVALGAFKFGLVNFVLSGTGSCALTDADITSSVAV